MENSRTNLLQKLKTLFAGKSAYALLAIVALVAVAAMALDFGEPAGSADASDAAVNEATDPDAIPRDEKGGALGYLAKADLPDSKAFLPLPPAFDAEDHTSSDGSPLKAADEAIAADVAANVYGSDRWALAALDAAISEPSVACHFNCDLGVSVSPEATPHLYALLVRTATTANDVGSSMKKAANRVRPYVEANPLRNESGVTPAWATNTPNAINTCRQDGEEGSIASGSYPSGTSAIGYSLGLVLAALDPADSSKILQRARQYGESRVVCNFHWFSDISAGRDVASAAFAALQSNANFLADFEAARTEFTAAKDQAVAAGVAPTKTYQIKSDTAVAADLAFVDEVNERFLNWDCAKEQAVLDGFKLVK